MSALSVQDLEILNESSSKISEDFTVFANILYKNLFSASEESRHYFCRDFHGIGNGDAHKYEDMTAKLTPMAKAMSHAVKQLITTVNECGSESRAMDMKRIAAKHVSRGVKYEFYPLLGKSLIEAIKESLGDDVDYKVISAWKRAYLLVSKEMMDHEKRIIKELEAKKDGYSGFRSFRVVAKEEVDVSLGFDFSDDESDEEDECEKAVNFTLEPVDGKPVPSFEPGQHVAFRLFLPDYGMSHRNYTLAGEPNGKTYSVSLRPDTDKSVCTSLLREKISVGDEILVSPPIGSQLVMESLVE